MSRAFAPAIVLSLLVACSVLQPPFVASEPGPDGKKPVEVVVTFVGNSGISESRLRRAIEDYMLDLSRDPTREAAVYDAALELEDLYRGEGYPTAKVSYEYDAAHARPRFKIDEGPLVTVEMHVAGNHAHDEDDLLELWSRESSGVLGLGAPAFVEAHVRAFADSLRSFYRARGWLDVQVEEPKIEVDLERGLAKVHIQITEGEPHVIHKVEIDARVREALGAELPSAPEGKRCSASETQSYGFELRTRLRKKGHPNPRVEVEVLRREGGGPGVDLRVVGDPGPVAKVASVALAGNKKTIDGVVRGKLQLEPGERYDGTKIDDAVRRLYLTGLFKSVEIVETPVDGDPTRLALEIRVDELQSRAVELLAGYGSYEQLRGGVRLEEKNLFGTGRDGALDNKISMKGWSSGLTLTDPDFLSTSSALTVGAEYFVREEPSFTDEAVGGTIALSRTLVDKLTARVGYTYRDRIGATADTQLPEDQLVDYTEGRVFVELRNDRRDSFLFPKRGHAELLAFERIAPEFGADVDLDRLTLRVSTIVGISRSLRLVLRSEQGALWPHDGSANVPLQERFFNGGEDSVRSFREARLGPKDAGGEAIGGEYRNIFGAELRFPFKGTFEGATFFDAGNVGRHVKDFGFDELRFGVGAGLRWLLPIGPARVDVAWNPDREGGERGWVVHFSVGYPY